MSYEIRFQADDFFKAHQVLRQNFDTATLAIAGPSIVCLAFSVELYLKDLYFVVTGKAPFGHDISKLFEDLPQDIKQAIFAHKSISQNPFMTRGNTLLANYYSDTYTPYERFLDQIKAISQGFIKWRYSFESSVLRYETFFALAFIEAVKSTADSNRKSSINKS